jgi:hypothetical protein
MAKITAQAVFSGPSLLPEDKFVNTFHFSNADDYAVHAVAVDLAIEAFYTTIGSELAKALLRAYEVKTYNLADEMPRVPLVFPGTLPANGLTDVLPSEVAVCLSYTAGPPVTKNRRGRIFIGPLGANASVATAGQFPIVAPTLITKLKSAATTLAADNAASWAIMSRVLNKVPRDEPVFYDIGGGWVDDAFDTQRRRGIKAQGRNPW